VTRPDGTWSQTTWGPTSAAPTAAFTTVDHPGGGAQVQTVVTPTVGGGHLATITSSDGSVETVRITAREVDNPDGSTTRIFTFPDGDTDAFTTAPDGRVVHHEAHHADDTAQSWADPVTSTGPSSQVSTDPVTGVVTTVTDDADGHHTTTTGLDGARTSADIAPDASWARTSDDGHGGTTESFGTGDLTTQMSTKNADGSWYSATDDGDGVHWEMSGTADGTTTETHYEADGSWYRNVNRPDGTRVETFGDPGGATDGSYTEYDADGSGTTYAGDGTTITMRPTPDGGTERIATAPDGTVTTTEFGPDGFGTSETVLHPDGTGTRTYSLPDDTTRAVPVTVGPDGTILETPPTPSHDPGNAGNASSETPVTPAAPTDVPVEENVTLHHGNLQIFRYHDGHIEIFASWEGTDQVVERSFPPGADWRNTAIHESPSTEIQDGVGTYHYEKTVTYADGRMERVKYGGVQPIWDDWF
jgi:hypothetical protein